MDGRIHAGRQHRVVDLAHHLVGVGVRRRLVELDFGYAVGGRVADEPRHHRVGPYRDVRDYVVTVAVGHRRKGSPDDDDIGSDNGLAGGGIAHVTRDTSGFDDGEGCWREERADEQQDESNGIDRHGRSGRGVQERR